MPPTAAATGSAARRGSRRSPATNSRLSSSPATKKKIASSPSAAHWASVRSRCSAAGPTRRLAQRAVRLAPRRVRPDQGDDRGADQQHPADGLGAQDVADPAGFGPAAAAEQCGRAALGGDVRHGSPLGVDDNAADQASRRTAYYITRPASDLPAEPEQDLGVGSWRRSGPSCAPAAAGTRGPLQRGQPVRPTIRRERTGRSASG